MTSIAVGSHWRRKRKDRRCAVVVGLSGPPWNYVDYRYSSAGESRGHGQIRDRISTTSMNETRFIEEFELIPETNS